MRFLPDLTGDDLYVDKLFDADEKAVVATDSSVVKTPVDVKSLLAILRRNHKGGTGLRADEHRAGSRVTTTGLDTAVAVVQIVRGPRSAVDALVYRPNQQRPHRSSQPTDQKILRVGHGFRNFDNYRLRLFAALRNHMATSHPDTTTRPSTTLSRVEPVYLALALAVRCSFRQARRWERDESGRLAS